MGMVVQHNMSAMNANRNLGVISGQLSKSTEKLSSGYRINRAGDDAAGLAISEKMRGQVRGLNRASTNAQDGISLIQTAEGALTETHSILQRMRELAVQAASDTNTDEDRTQIQNEIEQLTNEVDRIASTTEFNTMKLLDGSRAGAVSSKDGSAMVEGTFTNSMVNVEITTDNSADSEYTEIARIEVTKDFTDGMSTVAKDKYSISELKDAYDFITTDTKNTDYNDTAEWADNVKSAVKELTDNNNTDKKDLAGLKDTVKSYDTAIETNKSALTTTVVNLENMVLTEWDATAGGGSGADTGTKVSMFAAGVTKDDVAKAVNNLVDAYVKSGQTQSAAGDEITKATQELKALFNNDSTTITQGLAASTTLGSYSGDTNTNTAPSMTTIGDAPSGRGSTDAATAAAVTTSATAVTEKTGTIAQISAQITGGLESIAKKMAEAYLGKAQAEKNVEKMQNNIELVGNEELMKAYKAYDVAKNELDGATSEPEKEIAQAKLDTATDALNKLNKTGEEVISVTDLFGNTGSVDKFEIGKKVADDGTLTINLKNSAGSEDTVITISNANQLKAGDVITITSKAKVESHAANSGEEALRLQIGANSGQEMNLSINSMRAKDLGIVQTKEGKEGQALDVTSQATASLAVNAFDLAIQKVSTERSKMGAVQNRLEHTISNLDTSAENLQSAESRIRDTDMAEEMTNYSKNNILQQAGQSMLAQANQSTQGVLSLLQ